ncbi:unnamed protein product [Ostreobium quekettii]|uniref:Arginine deiminase n=1 Tax=Ostreobium quekettii TaxID=121088 RepID=A0A8S1IRF3_9CHLO|nr:unnamed protein product [Ostreobium quekettii]|eukprot:evm.model.scf_39.7 EVM.evm.TU.scf_39.7   scf_39:47161-50669(+)
MLWEDGSPRTGWMGERSTSYQDVLEVETRLPLPTELGRRGTAPALVDCTSGQVHENDFAEVVLVCEPEGPSLMMGGLHPRASLFDRPVNLDHSRQQHKKFRQVLRSYGLRVITVREVLAFGADDHVAARLGLEDLAMNSLSYRLAEGVSIEDVRENDRFYLTDDYKQTVLEGMGVAQLIDVLMSNPTVYLSPSDRDTGLRSAYEFHPLSNLVYTRDQQVTTAKGIVMGRLRSSQRQREVDLMRFCLKKLGLPVLGEIREPGFLEGGDFIPAGRDLCFIGIGLRSNFRACQQLMDNDWLGTRRLAVVSDGFEQHQDRMHLDCVFSITGDKCCMMLEEMMGMDSPTRRLVSVYTRTCGNGGTCKYELTREHVEFSQFMKEEGYNIIPIKAEHQLQYACNVLNLGGGRILSVHPLSARQLVRSPHFHGTVQVIEFSSITSMYGAVHCSTQILRRQAKPRQGWPRTRPSSARVSDSSIVDLPRSEMPNSEDESMPENGGMLDRLL